jgi:glycosyltransferase involved in cell wall biosynthesis
VPIFQVNIGGEPLVILSSGIERVSYVCHDLLVSVIMNGYNCEKYLKQAIDSVFAQTYTNWEIIFWDNGSSDATQSIATSYGPKLRYFRSETNTTLGSARNEALKKAQGNFIAFLDTDDYWLPEKLSLQVAILESNTNVDFIYSNYYLLNQETGLMSKGLRNQEPSGDVFGRFLQHYSVNLQTVLLRRLALDSLDHLFDERLTLCEEFDLFMRLLYKGTAHYMDTIMVVYRIHASMSSVRHIDKFPEENDLCIRKFLAMDPAIARTFAKELSTFRGKNAFWQARSDMFNHRPSEARRVLKPYLFQSVIFSIIYLATYSYVLWNFMLEINRRLK